MSFQNLLNQNAGDAKPPQPLPAGGYTVMVESTEFVESSQKQTPGLRAWLRPQAADEDVDLTTSDGETIELNKKRLREDFWLTEEALFRLKDFMEACGLTVEGHTFAELIPQLKGCVVKISVVQSASQDGTRVYNNVNGFSKAE